MSSSAYCEYSINMSLLKNRLCVLTEQMLVISLLINVIICASPFDYVEYYDDDQEPEIKTYEVKLGDTVMLACPLGCVIWRVGNDTEITKQEIIDGFIKGEMEKMKSRKNITVRSEEDAGFYDCWQPIGMFHYADQKFRIVISPEPTSIDPKGTTSTSMETKSKNTKAMGVDSEYLIASLLSSTSGHSKKSVFPQTLIMTKSSVAARNVIFWHILCPIIISLSY